MSFQLSTLGPSWIHNRKTTYHLAVSCNKKISMCNAWEKTYATAATKKDRVENTRLSLQLKCRRHALKHVVTYCSKSSGEENASDDMRAKFLEVCSLLKLELLNDPCFEWTDNSRLWIQQMLDYVVSPGGRFGRGLAVLDCCKSLKEGNKELSEDEVFDASVVGWCIEMIQGTITILDDLTDNSHARYGKPCWFRVAKVGKIAINDAVLLKAYVPRVLKKHLREKHYFVDLLDLFNEVGFQTFSGQMQDLISSGERDLSKFSLDRHRVIARNKTGYCFGYLPIACAFLLAGEDLEKHVKMKEVILEMGVYLQIVNDYLDCYGDPEKTGEIGSDIEDFTCSWLVVKAMELGNKEQKEILQEHYGKANPRDVAKVKGVYNDLNLRGAFAAYERETYDKLASRVEAYPNKTLQEYWATYEFYRQLSLY